MPRSLRQSKILELITTREIEKQEELVTLLRESNFDITQATISRDIKELGLIKILTEDKKYKYACIDATEQAFSNKYINIFKEAVINLKIINNIVLIKTINGLASAVNSFLDKLGVENSLGSTFGNDTVTIYFENDVKANIACHSLNKIIYG
ncbi:MAG: arginine repressor [Clostridia bacterium]|nr:arginine repressor [Clostridia bacterium]